jgi:hypothetical protein
MRRLLAGGSEGNARLTAGTAVVLTVLLVLEGLTLFGVRQLLLPHIFLGLLLVPPVLLKLASTGWRMLAYYRRVPEYVRRGPPHALLRVLVAPILVLSTLVLLGSGIAVAIVGHGGLLLGVHKASFVVWGVAFGIHFLAHVLELPGLAGRDWARRDLLRGSAGRRILLAVAVVAGFALAFAAFPLAHAWHDGFG